ncbi:MAG: ferredoxin--NADP reductase [Candidatus Zhuqueibacterota bacterium]
MSPKTGNTQIHRILEIRPLSRSVFCVRMEKGDLIFHAGQHVAIGFPGENMVRDYSIYSGERQPFLDLLVKAREIDEISVRLRACQQNDIVSLGVPTGDMVLENPKDDRLKYLFICTGTGIGPVHSMVISYPRLNYRIVHGISRLDDRVDSGDYDTRRYITCISQENSGDFFGRVTEYIRLQKIEPDTLCYISGFPEMVFEVYHLLQLKGIARTNIFTDLFFK